MNGIKLHNFQQSNLKNPHQDSRHNSSQNPSQHLPQTSPRSDRVRGHGALGLPVKRLWGQWRTIGWGVLNVLGISLGVMLVGCQRVDRVDLAAPGDRLAVDQPTSDQLNFHPVTTSPKLVPTSVNSQPSTPATPISDPIMTPIATPATTPATTPAVTPAATPLTRPITVYQANLACDQLQPQTLALPSGDRLTEIEAAINVILKQWTAGDFPIAGYRVTFADTTAIVDLRAAPDASRPWQALSTCEQFALFRAIRTTLMQHPAWAIEQVRFTSLGTPIEL